MFPNLSQKCLEGEGEHAAVPVIAALGKISLCCFPVRLFYKGYDLVSFPLLDIAVSCLRAVRGYTKCYQVSFCGQFFSLLDALQKAKQKRTVGDMRDVGTAWFSWLTDQIGAAAAGTVGIWDSSNLPTVLTGDGLLSTLYISSTMFYIQEVPNRDGWGNNYTYLYSGNPLTAQVMAIFSPGRTGGGSIQTTYTMGPFLATDYDQDIVWADGYFVRYPAGARIE